MLPASDRLAKFSWLIIAILTLFLCFAQAGMMLSLMAGGTLGRAVIPLALGLALLAGDILARKSELSGGQRLVTPLFALLVLGLSLAFALGYFDLSWDGQWYHQRAILTMARGWDPVTEPMYNFPDHVMLWPLHYAKGPWYFAAGIYKTTGLIEAGKAFNGLAWACLFLSVFAAALDWGLNRVRAAALALVAALNPVVMSVVTTYLIEAVLGSFMVVTMAAIFSSYRRPHPTVIVIGSAAAIVTINTKLTGLVYVGLILAAAGTALLLWQRARLRGFIGLSLATLFVAVGLFGYNPYVTNTLFRHHPFYPVMGTAAYPSLTAQGKEGIELYETPKNFIGHNRLYRLAYATFGRPGNQPYLKEADATLMWPFAFRAADLKYYYYHETRVAGFGPLFSGALLLSVALAAWCLWQKGPGRLSLLLIAIFISGSLLVSEHLWWARYGPQFWLLVLLPAVFIFWHATTRPIIVGAWLLVGLLAINGAIVAGVRLTWETRATQTLHRQHAEIRADGRPLEITFRWFELSGAERLKNAGIRFVEVSRKKLANPTMLMSVVDSYPDPTLYQFAANRTASP